MYTVAKPLFKYFQFKSIRIYDTVFNLHSKCTSVLLLLFSLVLSMKQYFGDPILCISDDRNTNFINSQCWTLGTYILHSHEFRFHTLGTYIQNSLNKSMNQRNFLEIAEGVGGETARTERVYLRYYQWIVFILLVQALVFYFPTFLWKQIEGLRLKQLCTDIGGAVLEDKVYKERLSLLVKYFQCDYRNIHFFYMTKYVLCELLNFLISIINIIMLDVILNGFWYKYIPAMAAIPRYDWVTWNHFSSRVFPKVSKCVMKKYGPSGSLTSLDILCLLPLNILNEKIFAFLWCWFILMTALATLKLLYRAATLLSVKFRAHLLRVRLRCKVNAFRTNDLLHISVGDWFILHKISTNINPMLFHDLIYAYVCGNFEF